MAIAREEHGSRRKAGFYRRRVLPRLIDLACGVGAVAAQRGAVVPRARGRVLEIGAGSGRNLPFYEATRIERLWALDPSPWAWALARRRLAASGVDVQFLEASAEAMPLADGSVDTVVLTYTLCTVPDPSATLAEARRVLAPDGCLLFCEHGLAPEPGVRRWQRRLNPLWSRLAGGCRLDRDVPGLMTAAGFAIVELWRGYAFAFRPAGFHYRGVARPTA